MNNSDQQINSDVLDDTFSKYKKNDKPNPQMSKKKQSNKMVIESNSQDSDDELLNAMNERDKNQQKPTNGNQQFNNFSRKKVPETINQNGKMQTNYEMQIEQKSKKLLTYNDLQDEIKFYLTEVYQFHQYKLLITGVMQNGQTINLIANKTYRQLYFALKKEQFETQQVSEQFMNKARKQIDDRLKKENINDFAMKQFEDKKYVFEIDGVCRDKRPYYKVRYSFQNQNVPSPDWEGDYFKYVFGTTYTPLELFIMNTKVKGPCWVKVDKNFLKQTKQSKTQVNCGLCLQIEIAESIEVERQMTKPPFLRVMSLSVKSAVPSQIQRRQLFPNTTRLDQNHIYCISYTYCEQYQVELKPPKYNQIQKTLHLKSFGTFNQKNFQSFDTEVQMFGKFIAELGKLDPDAIVCHDASKVLDSLIQRMAQVGDKNQKPRLGRLNHSFNLSSSNQHQRITAALAGRLIVDTFVHSKDMIKSVDYELENMAKHIKPQKNFTGMSEEQTKGHLEAGKTLFVLKKVRDQSDVAFALMNHLEVLQLTRNLSNICGNLWKRSLQNQRAERNEFLIMHQCARQDLIIPDKFRNFKGDDETEETDRKKYAGGMVIEPKKGMYNDFIILLDFNSLYPSIIRQYNVCFSKLDRPRIPLSKFYKSRKPNSKGQKMKEEGKDQDKKNQHIDDDLQVINPPPKEECVKEKWGFLPRLIDGIVNQRQKCKKAMKNASAEKCIILDIQQKSYKIVANSIYGCLGFSISRFYSKPMAALITRMGRQALQRANDIVSNRGGVQVIYGDTDSLMIQPTSLNKETDKQKLFEIKTLADDLKKSINKQYTNLEIDIDGIFKPILLLMKKKYVANKLQNFDKIIAGIDQQLKFNLEFKGIEVVRRDGCEVARSSLKRILQILMNSNKDDVEEIYEEIYKEASQLNEKLPILSHKDFLFSKQLNKKPKQYANGESLPHVKVALDRVRNGEKQQTLVNHTIYYLVCKPKLQSQDSLAKRCFDEKTFERSIKFAKDPSEKLQIDIDYYKGEILQPWMRIFMHLEEFNVEKLFQAFDVKDAQRKTIRKQISSQRDYVDHGLEDFLTNDMKQKSKKFNEQISSITCSNCQNTLNLSQDGQLITKCKYCPLSNSKQITSIISNKISMWIKQKSALYYNNKLKCQCQKVFPLTLISKCCRVQVEKKTTIPFEIHTFIYLAKELIEITVTKLQQKIHSKEIHNEDEIKSTQQTIVRLENISKKILDRFLENSDFENVSGIFDMFKI